MFSEDVLVIESVVLILEIKLHVGHIIEHKMRITMLCCNCSLGIPAANCFVRSVQRCCATCRITNVPFYFF